MTPKKRLEKLERKLNTPEPIQIIVVDWEGDIEPGAADVVITWDDEPDKTQE